MKLRLQKTCLDKENYKPVSTLSNVSRFFERIMFHKVSDFMTDKLSKKLIVCQLEGVNPTYERYILGPITVNRHLSQVSKKQC